MTEKFEESEIENLSGRIHELNPDDAYLIVCFMSGVLHERTTLSGNDLRNIFWIKVKNYLPSRCAYD